MENKKYIYCFTNKINNKKYIGSTINNPMVRYKQHLYHAKHPEKDRGKYPLYEAIRKYGIDNFTFEILLEKECNEQEIREIEHNYIIEYNTVSPKGYNQTDDTEHPLNDPLTYQKMKETKRNNAKRVIMINPTTNEIVKIYRSIVDCAENTGIDERKIGSCCRGERKTTSNYSFYWLDDNDNIIYPEYHRDLYKGEKGATQIQSSSKKVEKIDLQTGKTIKIYDTIALAARENDCDPSGISKVCKNKRNKVGGFGWRYYIEEKINESNT